MATLPTEDRTEYLVTRYIHESFLKEKDYQYPEALTLILIRFLGNIFLHFDVVHADYKQFVGENGRVLNINRTSASPTFTVASSYGFNRGISEIKLECNQASDVGSGDQIGVGTEIGQCYEKRSWMFNDGGEVYFMYGKDICQTVGKMETIKRFSRTWQWAQSHALAKGDIMAIRVDCDQWMISFFINDEMKGKPMEIEPGLTYYFLMSIQSKTAKYTLLN